MEHEPGCPDSGGADAMWEDLATVSRSCRLPVGLDEVDGSADDVSPEGTRRGLIVAVVEVEGDGEGGVGVVEPLDPVDEQSDRRWISVRQSEVAGLASLAPVHRGACHPQRIAHQFEGLPPTSLPLALGCLTVSSLGVACASSRLRNDASAPDAHRRRRDPRLCGDRRKRVPLGSQSSGCFPLHASTVSVGCDTAGCPVPCAPTGRGAAWLARSVWDAEVVGSNPTGPTSRQCCRNSSAASPTAATIVWTAQADRMVGILGRTGPEAMAPIHCRRLRV